MSLKAKIEAVIYASEEPVTLAQLTGLLGEEAQSELDALAAQQESLPLDDADEPTEPADPEAMNAEAFEGVSEPSVSGDAAEPVQALSAPPDSAGTQTLSPQPEAEPGSAQAEGAAVRPAADPGDPAAAETKATDAAAARARERRLRDYFRSLLDELIAEYANGDRGLEIREIAGGFRFATKPEYHDAVRGFVKSLKPPLKLSLQALETLAVVAYKQPVTAPEVSEIRGVDSGGVLGSLMARKLVATAGRKQVIGRPILYKTTKDFLVRFGLKDLNELPSIEEFEKMASEFAEAVQEEIDMATSSEEATRRSEEDAMANIHEAQPDGEPYSEENVEGEMPSAVPDNPADEVLTDGRISGLPPDYASEDYVEGDEVDTPAIDAEVQSNGQSDNKTGGA